MTIQSFISMKRQTTAHGHHDHDDEHDPEWATAAAGTPARPLQHTLQTHLNWLGLPATIVLLLLLWQALVLAFDYETFILPAPAAVVERFWTALESGLLWEHTRATFISAVGGFGVALLVSMVLGYILAHISWLERATAPVLAASAAMPIIAITPLIILWFGAGLTSRILIAALTAFFPILMNTIIALRGVPRELREMAMISGANRWQMLGAVELPLALPVFFTGVRIGLSRATIGAVVGEFVAGRYGLGALINIARSLFDTPLIFVALVMLSVMTMSFYLVASVLERLLVRWEA